VFFYLLWLAGLQRTKMLGELQNEGQRIFFNGISQCLTNQIEGSFVLLRQETEKK